MYSVLDYGRMAADPVRMDAYARAIARAVKPGSVVLDLGAGTGIFSLLAARAGARRVHAVDPNPAIWLLPEIAAENGLADRISIHPALSYDVELPERADVLVSDMRGVTSLHADNAGAIQDALARLLKPKATIIPASDALFVGLVESTALSERLERAASSFGSYGFVAKVGREMIVNTFYGDASHPLAASDLLSSAGGWANVDYATYDGRPLEGTVDLEITRSGVAHGLALWFEAKLLEGITFTTAPGWCLVYGRAFLPLKDAVRVVVGDRARVAVRAVSRGDRWAWDTELLDAQGATKAHFRQSTFFGTPASPQALLKASTTFRPQRSERGDRALRVLDTMNGERTVAELAELGPSSMSQARRVEEVHDLVARYAK
jgi:type I protein arginine methyltransferase